MGKHCVKVALHVSIFELTPCIGRNFPGPLGISCGAYAGTCGGGWGATGLSVKLCFHVLSSLWSLSASESLQPLKYSKVLFSFFKEQKRVNERTK